MGTAAHIDAVSLVKPRQKARQLAMTRWDMGSDSDLTCAQSSRYATLEMGKLIGQARFEVNLSADIRRTQHH